MHFWPDLQRIPTCPNSDNTWTNPSGRSALQPAYAMERTGDWHFVLFHSSHLWFPPRFPVPLFHFISCPCLSLLYLPYPLTFSFFSISSWDFSCTSHDFLSPLFSSSFSSLSARVMNETCELPSRNAGVYATGCVSELPNI